MGQKVNPIGLRLGVNRTWDSRWYASGTQFATLLHQDIAIRKFVRDKLKAAGISKIIIERPLKKCRVTVHTAKPGVVIGKKGADIEKLRKELSKIAPGAEVHLNLVEVRKPETDAYLVAEGVAQQLERRVAFRRAMKRAMQSAMRFGAQGIRINVSGRLGGAEIARMEWYREGRVPLHTLRADVDYGFTEADTAYGKIGVKVWIFKGEILEHDPMAQDKRALETGESRERRDHDNRGPRAPREDLEGQRPRRARRPSRQESEAQAEHDARAQTQYANQHRVEDDSPRVSARRAQLVQEPQPIGPLTRLNHLRERIGPETDTQRFARLLQGLQRLAKNKLSAPVDYEAELNWLAGQLSNGAPDWTAKVRNRSKLVALDIAPLLGDDDEDRRVIATKYLSSFARIVAPQDAPELKQLETSVAYALKYFHIGYFIQSQLHWTMPNRAGAFHVRIHRNMRLPGASHPLRLEGVRAGAKIEALINYRDGVGDHSILKPRDGEVDAMVRFEHTKDVEAPLPLLTIVVDGDIALQQHPEAPQRIDAARVISSAD